MNHEIFKVSKEESISKVDSIFKAKLLEIQLLEIRI